MTSFYYASRFFPSFPFSPPPPAPLLPPSLSVFPFLALSELVTPVVRSSARLGTVMQIRNNLITPPRYRVHHYKINIPLQSSIRRLRRRYLRKKSHHSSSFQLGKCNLFRPSSSHGTRTFRDSRFNINCYEFTRKVRF